MLVCEKGLLFQAQIVRFFLNYHKFMCSYSYVLGGGGVLVDIYVTQSQECGSPSLHLIYYAATKSDTQSALQTRLYGGVGCGHCSRHLCAYIVRLIARIILNLPIPTAH